MMPLREDTVAYPVLVALAGCLCQEMAALDGPELCYCGPIAGNLILDFCGGGSCNGEGCGGQAWVRFVDAFPSATFPNLDAGQSNCRSPLAFTLEVGVARCAPQGVNGPNGYTAPTLEEQLEAVRIQTADVAAMRRAIQCCFGSGDRDYIMGAYDQTQVNGGGCIGGTFNVTVWQEF